MKRNDLRLSTIIHYHNKDDFTYIYLLRIFVVSVCNMCVLRHISNCICACFIYYLWWK